MYAFFSVANPGSAQLPQMLDRVWRRVFGDRHFNRPEDRQYAIETFLKHNEEIKAYVEADRLLVYEVREGWGSLCAFLDVPAPDIPFPHLNDTNEFRSRILRATRIVRTVSYSILGAVALLLAWLMSRAL